MGVVRCISHPVHVLLQPLASCNFTQENKCMYTLKRPEVNLSHVCSDASVLYALFALPKPAILVCCGPVGICSRSPPTQKRVKDDCFCILCHTGHVCIVASQGRDRVEGFIY